MGGTKRGQLVLEWTDELRWGDLSTPLRAEVRALLRELLRRAVRGDGEAEGDRDQY
jgi:hypothetical protein